MHAVLYCCLCLTACGTIIFFCSCSFVTPCAGVFFARYFAIALLNAVCDTYKGADWIVAPLDGSLPPQPALDAAALAAAAARGEPLQALHAFDPFCAGFLSAEMVSLLVPALVDSWDKLRQCAFETLMKLPAPLPGWQTPDQLRPVVRWAADLMWSPRVRESDAGKPPACLLTWLACVCRICASVYLYWMYSCLRCMQVLKCRAFKRARRSLSGNVELFQCCLWIPAAGSRLMKLVFSKYVLQLHWRVRLWPTVDIQPPAAAAANVAPANAAASAAIPAATAAPAASASPTTSGHEAAAAASSVSAADHSARFDAILCFLESAGELIGHQLGEARSNLLAACRHSISHGALLMLRYGPGRQP